MMYVDGDVSQKITARQFKNMFGISWAKYKSANRKVSNLNFDDLWCGIDPYDSEILCETNPIVERSEQDLKDAVEWAADGI